MLKAWASLRRGNTWVCMRGELLLDRQYFVLLVIVVGWKFHLVCTGFTSLGYQLGQRVFLVDGCLLLALA